MMGPAEPGAGGADRDVSLSPDAVVRRSPAIVFTDLDDTVVMMDPDDGAYHELDPIGARIWALLEQPGSAAQICTALLDDYEVTPEDCRREVLAFLVRARELRIVEVAEEQPQGISD